MNPSPSCEPTAEQILVGRECSKPNCPCHFSARRGRGKTHCPSHTDEHPSLSVNTENGKTLLHCHSGGCTQADIIKNLQDLQLWPRKEETSPALSAPPKGRTDYAPSPSPAPPSTERNAEPMTHTATYEIKDERGTLIALHERHESADGKKRFTWKQSKGAFGLNGTSVAEMPLFGSELLSEAAGKPVVICEGEKAAQALRSVGYLGLGTVTGANATPCVKVLSVLKGRTVYLWPDNDDKGKQHMERIARSLTEIGITPHWVEWKESPEKGDAADLVMMHGNDAKNALKNLFTTAREGEKADSSFPPCLSAAELMQMEFPEPEWIIPGYLPKGTTVLSAKPKIGKTWLSQGLSIAVSTGGMAFGKIPVKKGSVLYLSIDDRSKRRIQERIGLILNGSPAPDNLFIQTEWPRMGAGGEAAFEGWMKEYPDTRLIVIDTLERIRPQRQRSDNSYSEDYAATGGLTDLASKYDIAVLIVHHNRKANADDPFEMMMGNYGLFGGLDNGWIIQRERGRADGFLYISGRDMEETEKALRWDAPTYSWILEGDAEEFRLTGEKAEIVEAVREAYPELLGPKEIAERTDKKPENVRFHCSKMVKDGTLISPRYGKYTIPAHTAHTTHTSESEDASEHESGSKSVSVSESVSDEEEATHTFSARKQVFSGTKPPQRNESVSGVSSVSGLPLTLSKNHKENLEDLRERRLI